jgi:hypothetical protein
MVQVEKKLNKSNMEFSYLVNNFSNVEMLYKQFVNLYLNLDSQEERYYYAEQKLPEELEPDIENLEFFSFV